MLQAKILTVAITCLLLAEIVSGCDGSNPPAISRTVVSEQLVTRIDSPKTIRTLIYSPDARRVAYVSEMNGAEYIVVDGVSGKGYDSIDINFRTFSPDSKRVAYVAVILGEKPPAGNKRFVVIDGEEGDEYSAASVFNLTFSPDGKHIAYVADGHVFLDRVPVKGPEGIVKSTPLFSPDSQHLVYIVDQDGKQSVVVDGVSSKQYDKIGTIAFSPDDRRLAYRAKAGKNWFMVVNEKEERQYEAGESDYNPIVFSPDSNHLAYVADENLGIPGHRQFVILDEDEGKRYKEVSREPVFSPDSQHLVYRAWDGTDSFVVFDDKEQRTSGGGFVFSPDSNRLAYQDSKQGMWAQTIASWVIVDGKKGKTYNDVGDITFSPDSKHVSYIANTSRGKMSVIVDGTRGNEYDFLGKGFLSVSELGLKKIAWDSPNSFHYLAQKGTGVYLVEELIEQH